MACSFLYLYYFPHQCWWCSSILLGVAIDYSHHYAVWYPTINTPHVPFCCDGHYGSFQLGPISTRAAMNILIPVFGKHT